MAPLDLEDWSDAATVSNWLQRQKPDVIITPSADVIRPALALARRRVPEEPGLALLACPEAGDAHSDIYQNGPLIGVLAVDALLGLVERHERGLLGQATTRMVEGPWNEGRTLPRRR